MKGSTAEPLRKNNSNGSWSNLSIVYVGHNLMSKASKFSV